MRKGNECRTLNAERPTSKSGRKLEPKTGHGVMTDAPAFLFRRSELGVQRSTLQLAWLVPKCYASTVKRVMKSDETGKRFAITETITHHDPTLPRLSRTEENAPNRTP